jgi:hypothetical protein
MGERMSHEQYVQSCRHRAAALAQGILAGSIPLLESCHTLASLHRAVEVAEQDADFKVFALVSSECDALPTGGAKEHWSPEALARLEPEVQSAIAWATPLVLPACRSIVQRFGA